VTTFIWAEISWTNVATWTLPVRIGAVAAAAVAGALVSGLVVQLLSRGVSRQKAPRPAVNLVRLGGAIAAGLGAFLYLFGPGGGYGPGHGPGGDGPGGTEKTSHADPKEGDTKSAEKKKSDSREGPRDRTATELRVEILSEKVLSAEDAANKRYFRIHTAAGPEMMSLNKVIQFIVDLKLPPSVVYVVVYEDAAATDRIRVVKALRDLAADLKKNPDEWVKPKSAEGNSPRP
jgi:hypothetical protein